MTSTTRKWLHGLGAAVIGGGASAVVSTVTASMIAPTAFNVGPQLHSFVTLAGASFAMNAILSAMFYLKQSPLPPEESEITNPQSPITKDNP